MSDLLSDKGESESNEKLALKIAEVESFTLVGHIAM
jgi:hypothetical protein